MKRRLFLLVLLFLTLFPVLSVQAAGPNTFVLLIGINKYAPEVGALEYCVRDTEGLAKSFRKIGVPEENIIVMVDDAEKVTLRPSRSNIERQIELVTEIVTENDQLVVAFAGHGVQLDGKAYLCPNDTDLEKPDTFLSRSWIYRKLDNCPARKKLFITDACRNEITARGRSISGARSLNDPTSDMESHGFALLASCSKNQKSYEDPDFKHGVFTYFIMQGIEGAADENGDKNITFEELYTYVMKKTRTHVMQTLQKPQLPTRGGEYSGEFILASLPKTEPPKVQPAPVSTPAFVTQPGGSRSVTTLELPQQPSTLPPIPEGRQVRVSNTSQLLDAMKNVQNGDVIILATGVYILSEKLYIGFSKEQITLYGDPTNPQNVKIRCNRDNDSIEVGKGRHLKLIGLDISNKVYGVSTYSARTDILFCNIHDCGSHGIYSSSESDIFVDNSTIIANDFGIQGGGTLTIKNCLVKNNKGSGIVDYGEGKTELTNCVVTTNGGAGINIGKSGSVATVAGCTITANGRSGISIHESGAITTVTDCKIQNNTKYAVWVFDGAEGEFRNNILSDNKEGNWNIGKNAGKVTRIGNTPNE